MIEKFEFTPITGFLDSGAFPNPQGEEITRQQLQKLHDQTRDYINAVIDTINGYNITNKVTSESVKYLRVANGVVEWSVDNVSWFPLGSGEGGGSAIPGGGLENQALVRGSAEYTAKWMNLIDIINVASAELNGLMSASDKTLFNKAMLLTNNGESISAENITETEMRYFLKNSERALLFNKDGDALFYSIQEADNIFQTKIQVGATLPETAEEGDIFLLYEVE